MKRLLPYVALLILTGCDQETLQFACPSTCYDGPEGTEGVGICKAGVPVCNRTGIVSCEGQVLPYGRDFCDPVDWNCNGVVNDTVPSIPPYHEDNKCKQCGVCEGTYERCSNEGTWYCDYPSGYPSPEVCDGSRQDEDCDCSIDEQEDIYPDPIYCYTGPAGTSNKGECRPGLETCGFLTGDVFCDDTTPKVEVCDGLDNDCNGVVDDVENIYDAVAMVLAIDVSTSMSGVHQAVTQVMCDYASSSGTDQAWQFALLLIAEPNQGFSVFQNFTDAQTLCDVLPTIPTGGAWEPSLSAAEAVSDPSNPLLLQWPPGNVKRIFVGFTDESAQAIENTFEAKEDAVVNTIAYCAASEMDLYWFTSDMHANFFIDQALGCDGDLFRLSNNPLFMLRDMNDIVATVCGVSSL